MFKHTHVFIFLLSTNFSMSKQQGQTRPRAKESARVSLGSFRQHRNIISSFDCSLRCRVICETTKAEMMEPRPTAFIASLGFSAESRWKTPRLLRTTPQAKTVSVRQSSPTPTRCEETLRPDSVQTERRERPVGRQCRRRYARLLSGWPTLVSAGALRST